jgi:hypothetical protein
MNRSRFLTAAVVWLVVVSAGVAFLTACKQPPRRPPIPPPNSEGAPFRYNPDSPSYHR